MKIKGGVNYKIYSYNNKVLQGHVTISVQYDPISHPTHIYVIFKFHPNVCSARRVTSFTGAEI